MGAFDLSGKQALVTGASKGIGRAIALAYAEAGADVALVSRSAESLAEVAKEVEALGRRAVVLPADLTDRDAAVGAVAGAIDGLGHLDIVVNNAGGSNFLVEFKDLRLSGWDKIIRLNLDSTMAVCHAVGTPPAGPGHRLGHQRGVGGGAGRALPGPLRGGEGGGGGADQDAGRGVGAGRGTGQRPVPRLDGHRPEPQPLGRRSDERGDGVRVSRCVVGERRRKWPIQRFSWRVGLLPI